MTNDYDVIVVGAGVFGAWTAYELRRAGRSVLLLDAYGPANSRASSGGESRIIRMGYGADEIYTRMAMRSLPRWKALFRRVHRPLFRVTGMLWLAPEDDSYVAETLRVLAWMKVPHEQLTSRQLRARFPQFDVRGIGWGLLEPQSGVLMARQAVQAVVEESIAGGVEYRMARIQPPQAGRRLQAVISESGDELRADAFVFACGPWLAKMFPAVLGDLIFPTRQEVVFLGPRPGDESFSPPAMPAWYDRGREVYGIPSLESRGFKIAFDAHGPAFDPDSGSRVVRSATLHRLRNYVQQRFPRLAASPVVETRVCQYENTSNGDLLIDRHPRMENVWLVGGGSGHGFKHGPAVGGYVTSLVLDRAMPEPRFALAGKATVKRRQVH